MEAATNSPAGGPPIASADSDDLPPSIPDLLKQTSLLEQQGHITTREYALVKERIFAQDPSLLAAFTTTSTSPKSLGEKRFDVDTVRDVLSQFQLTANDEDNKDASSVPASGPEELVGEPDVKDLGWEVPLEDSVIPPSVASHLALIQKLSDSDHFNAAQKYALQYLCLRGTLAESYLDGITAEAVRKAHSDPSLPESTAMLNRVTTLQTIAQSHIRTEEQCQKLQQQELTLLQEIFHEELMTGSLRARPPVLTVRLSLQKVDWFIDISFRFPPLYPLTEPVSIKVFVTREQMSTAEVLEQMKKQADSCMKEGQPAVFQCVQRATEWMNAVTSAVEDQFDKEAAAANSASIHRSEKSEKKSSVEAAVSILGTFLQPHDPLPAPLRAVTEGGAGPLPAQRHTCGVEIGSVPAIHHAQLECIQHVRAAVGPEATATMAKAALRGCNWDEEKAIEEVKAKIAALKSVGNDEDEPESAEPAAAEETKQAAKAPAKKRFTIKRPTKAKKEKEKDKKKDSGKSKKADDAAAAFIVPIDAIEFTCLGCMEQRDCRLGVGTECGHWLCVGCWLSYLWSCIREGQAYVKCPGLNCPEHLDEELVQALLPPLAYQRYRRWLSRSFLELGGWKHCPNTRCTRVFRCLINLMRGPQGQRYPPVPAGLVCVCGAQVCALCSQPSHFPVPCEILKEFSNKVDNSPLKEILFQKMNETFIKVETKPCPRCGSAWEKIEGCNLVCCAKCNTQFCWECGETWLPTHSSHFNCPNIESGRKERKAYGVNLISSVTLDITAMDMEELKRQEMVLNQLKSLRQQRRNVLDLVWGSGQSTFSDAFSHLRPTPDQVIDKLADRSRLSRDYFLRLVHVVLEINLCTQFTLMYHFMQPSDDLFRLISSIQFVTAVLHSALGRNMYFYVSEPQIESGERQLDTFCTNVLRHLYKRPVTCAPSAAASSPAATAASKAATPAPSMSNAASLRPNNPVVSYPVLRAPKVSKFAAPPNKPGSKKAS